MFECFNIVILTEYKRDLEKDLISETSGDFSKLIMALLKVRSACLLFISQLNIYLQNQFYCVDTSSVCQYPVLCELSFSRFLSLSFIRKRMGQELLTRI